MNAKRWGVSLLSFLLCCSLLFPLAACSLTPPAETELAETEPAGTEPAGTEPAGTEPAGTEPAGTEPAGTEPADTEPAGTEPAGTEPAETEPAETEPAETEPVETKPVETEPAETDPAETEPTETEHAAETEKETEEKMPETKMLLPASSGEVSPALARQLLSYCAAKTMRDTAVLLKEADFEVVEQKNYDKATTDRSHTSAFTIAEGKVTQGTTVRTALLVVVRGTWGSEWYSNFDFQPEGNVTAFAENFYLVAQDIMATLSPILQTYREQDPVIVVTGHSRGGAAANLVGAMLDKTEDTGDVYVYTFASPTTVRDASVSGNTDNIINFINPADLITGLPLAAWNFTRAGKDILLPCAGEDKAATDDILSSFLQLAKTPLAYYTVRHALSAPGESSSGKTTFEMMQILCAVLSGQISSLPMEMLLLLPGMVKSDFGFIAQMILTAMSGEIESNFIGVQHHYNTYDTLIRKYQSEEE